MAQEKERIGWLDTARGIAMLLVLLGHILEHVPCTAEGQLVHDLIYSFHMSLFFILSGMLFRASEGESGRSGSRTSFLRFVMRKARTILLPYAVFCFLMTLWDVFHDRYLPFSSLAETLRILFLMRPTAFQWYWFLPAMFTAQCLFYLLIKYVRRWPVRLLLCLLLGGCGLLLSKSPVSYWLPLHLDIALFSLIFLYAGFSARTCLAVLRRKLSGPLFRRILSRRGLLIMSLFVFSVSNFIFLFVLKEYAQYYYNLDVRCLPLFAATSLSGSAIVILLSKIPFLARSRVLRWYGRNSLSCFGLHYFPHWALIIDLAYLLLSETTPWYAAWPVFLLLFLVLALLTAPLMYIYTQVTARRRN